jgi:hypothetical protein
LRVGPAGEVALGDRSHDAILVDSEVFLGGGDVAVAQGCLEQDEVVAAVEIYAAGEGFSEAVGAEAPVVQNPGQGEGSLDNLVGLVPGHRAHPTLGVRLAAGKERQVGCQVELESQPPELAAQGVVEFGQHRHPAGVAIMALEVARRDADPGDDLVIAKNVAHGKGEDLVDAESGEPLGGYEGPVTGFQLANEAEELALLGAGEWTSACHSVAKLAGAQGAGF